LLGSILLKSAILLFTDSAQILNKYTGYLLVGYLLAQAEEVDQRSLKDPVALLNRLHAFNQGIANEDASSYMKELREDRKQWRGECLFRHQLLDPWLSRRIGGIIGTHRLASRRRAVGHADASLVLL